MKIEWVETREDFGQSCKASYGGVGAEVNRFEGEGMCLILITDLDRELDLFSLNYSGKHPEYLLEAAKLCAERILRAFFDRTVFVTNRLSVNGWGA